MNKAVFMWWAHKEIWNTIAMCPTCIKNDIDEVFDSIVAKHKDLCHKRYSCWGFVCQARHDLAKLNNKTFISCEEHCPLNWRVGESEDNDCIWDSKSLLRRFNGAMARKNFSEMSEIAAKIRDLPLNANAHKYYDIKASPGD